MKKKAKARKAAKTGQVIDTRGGWMRYISEPYAGAWQRNAGIEVDNVLNHPTAFACQSLIASDIAKLPINLVKRNGDGLWDVIESPAYSPVLRKPNDYQTRIEFIQSWLNSKLGWGNAYIFKERDERQVVKAMYVLAPQRVRTMVTEVGDVYYEVSKDNLSGLYDASMTVPARDMIHDKYNPLWHPLVGISPIFAAGAAAIHGLRIQNAMTQFFANGARPSGILMAPKRIDKETADRLNEEWTTRFAGTGAGKVAILGDGLEYKPLMMNAVDAEMIKQLGWDDEKICAAYHVPPFMVGVGPPELNANVETKWQQYYAQCLQILIETMEALLDEGLGLMTGPRPMGVEFDLDGLLRMDQTALIKAEVEAVKGGVKAPNEARRRLGLKKVKGGEMPFMQNQMWSLEALSERPSPGETPPAPPAAPPPPALPPPEEPTEEQAAEEQTASFVARFKQMRYANAV